MVADRASLTRAFEETRRHWPIMTFYERFEQLRERDDRSAARGKAGRE